MRIMNASPDVCSFWSTFLAPDVPPEGVGAMGVEEVEAEGPGRGRCRRMVVWM